MMQQLEKCDEEKIAQIVNEFGDWMHPRSDMYLWAGVFNRFDDILARIVEQGDFEHMQRNKLSEEDKLKLKAILKFTRMLLENCLNRTLYSSFEHLNSLLCSRDDEIVEMVLWILLRSAQRAGQQRSVRQVLPVSQERLMVLAKLDNMKELLSKSFLPSLNPIQHSFYKFDQDKEGYVKIQIQQMEIEQNEVHDLLLKLEKEYNIPYPTKPNSNQAFINEGPHPMFSLQRKIKMAKYCSDPLFRERVVCIRILSMSILVHMLPEEQVTKVIPSLTVSELCEILMFDDFYRLKSAALYALDVIAMVRSKLQEVLLALNVSVQHGVLLSLMQKIISVMTQRKLTRDETDVFEGLHTITVHFTSIQNSGSMLLNGGIMGILVSAFNVFHLNKKQAIKVVGLMDSIVYGFPNGFALFLQAQGIDKMIQKIALEVQNQEDVSWLKSLLKFTLHMMQSVSAPEVRSLIDSTIPQSLLHIFEEHKNPQILALAINILSNFIHTEPTCLSILQEMGIPQALVYTLRHGIGANWELLQAVPNVFGALCLNSNGQELLKNSEVIRMFLLCFLQIDHVKILVDNENAIALGQSLDEFMRHQPGFKYSVRNQLGYVLEQICLHGFNQDVKHRYFESNVQEVTLCVQAIAKLLEGLLQNSTSEPLAPELLEYLLRFYDFPCFDYDFPNSKASQSIIQVVRYACELDAESTCQTCFRVFNACMVDIQHIELQNFVQGSERNFQVWSKTTAMLRIMGEIFNPSNWPKRETEVLIESFMKKISIQTLLSVVQLHKHALTQLLQLRNLADKESFNEKEPEDRVQNQNLLDGWNVSRLDKKEEEGGKKMSCLKFKVILHEFHLSVVFMFHGLTKMLSCKKQSENNLKQSIREMAKNLVLCVEEYLIGPKEMYQYIYGVAMVIMLNDRSSVTLQGTILYYSLDIDFTPKYNDQVCWDMFAVLLSSMSNIKSIDSIYSGALSDLKSFDYNQFLKTTKKICFLAITKIQVSKNSSRNILRTIINLMKHEVEIDPIRIEDVMNADLSMLVNRPVTPDTSQLITLTEMGFSENVARIALSRTGNNVERAADYILNHPEIEFQQIQTSSSDQEIESESSDYQQDAYVCNEESTLTNLDLTNFKKDFHDAAKQIILKVAELNEEAMLDCKDAICFLESNAIESLFLNLNQVELSLISCILVDFTTQHHLFCLCVDNLSRILDSFFSKLGFQHCCCILDIIIAHLDEMDHVSAPEIQDGKVNVFESRPNQERKKIEQILTKEVLVKMANLVVSELQTLDKKAMENALKLLYRLTKKITLGNLFNVLLKCEPLHLVCGIFRNLVEQEDVLNVVIRQEIKSSIDKQKEIELNQLCKNTMNVIQRDPKKFIEQVQSLFKVKRMDQQNQVFLELQDNVVKPYEQKVPLMEFLINEIQQNEKDRLFCLKMMSELILSYTCCKLEFMKRKKFVLFLLEELLPWPGIYSEPDLPQDKKQRLQESQWASICLSCVCANGDCDESLDSLNFIRKSILDLILKSFQNQAQNTELRYGKFLALADLVHRILTNSTKKRKNQNQQTEVVPSNLVQLFIEKDFVGILVQIMSTVNVYHPKAKFILMSIIKPVEFLAQLSVKMGGLKPQHSETKIHEDLRNSSLGIMEGQQSDLEEEEEEDEEEDENNEESYSSQRSEDEEDEEEEENIEHEDSTSASEIYEIEMEVPNDEQRLNPYQTIHLLGGETLQFLENFFLEHAQQMQERPQPQEDFKPMFSLDRWGMLSKYYSLDIKIQNHLLNYFVPKVEQTQEPRYTVLIGDQEHDLTDTGIYPTFVDALTEDIREDVLTQFLAEAKSAEKTKKQKEPMQILDKKHLRIVFTLILNDSMPKVSLVKLLNLLCENSKSRTDILELIFQQLYVNPEQMLFVLGFLVRNSTFVHLSDSNLLSLCNLLQKSKYLDDNLELLALVTQNNQPIKLPDATIHTLALCLNRDVNIKTFQNILNVLVFFSESNYEKIVSNIVKLALNAKEIIKGELKTDISSFGSSSSYQSVLLRHLKTLDFLSLKHQAEFPEVDLDEVWTDLSLHLEQNQTSILLPLIESFMVQESRKHNDLFDEFTTKHKHALNLLVLSNPSLLSGSFSILVKYSKVLEFENKKSYFYQQLFAQKRKNQAYPPLQLNVRRNLVFEDSLHQLQHKSGDEIKFGKLLIRFYEEDGVDGGGLTREWFQVLARQIFNPDYCLFHSTTTDKITHQPNRASSVNSNHLQLFKFVGRFIGKAIYDQRLLDCYFSRSFYKHMLGKNVDIRDMEAVDPEYYKSLCWILENDIENVINEMFCLEQDDFGTKQIIELKPNGQFIQVNNQNKHEYVQLVVQQKLTFSIQEQIDAFLKGFYEIVPQNLLNIFNEQELELVISGLPEIDVDDWKNNTEYVNYNSQSQVVNWFWRMVRSMDNEQRAKLVQYCTGTSKVPLEGFKALQGSTGLQKFQIVKDPGGQHRLPSAHTCFNQLDLPEYSTYETLRKMVLKAIEAASEGFGLV